MAPKSMSKMIICPGKLPEMSKAKDRHKKHGFKRALPDLSSSESGIEQSCQRYNHSHGAVGGSGLLTSAVQAGGCGGCLSNSWSYWEKAKLLHCM